MKTRYLLPFLLLVLYVQAASAEVVYKGTDKQGNTIYSDQPLQNGEQITINPTPSYSLPALPDNQTTTTTQEAMVDYQLSIIAPPDQQTFPHAVQSFDVTLALTPKLLPGDQINLIVNGQPYGNYSQALTFPLSGFPRGAYKIQAVITSEKDPSKVKAQSNTITIYQQRAVVKAN